MIASILSRRLPCICVVGLALLAGPMPPAVAKTDELDAFSRQMESYTNSLNTNAQERTRTALQRLNDLNAAIKRGDSATATRTAQELAVDPWVPANIRATAEALSREIPQLLAARADEFVADVEKAVERTRAECLAARSESDLKPLFRDLSALDQRQPPSDCSPVLARAAKKLRSAIATTDAWMDYLLAKAGGSRTKALDALRRAANDGDKYPILPAAEYEKRVTELSPESAPAPDLNAALAKIKSLQDVEAVAPEVEVAVAARNNDWQYQGAGRWFAAFRAATAAYLAGDIGEAWRQASSETPREGGPGLAQMYRLRAMLLGELVPKYLKYPPDAQRRPDESFEDQFRRLLAETAQQERWEDVYRMASARAAAPGSGASMPWISELSSATNSYLQALRLEEAGELGEAIVAYQRVIRSHVDLAPVKQAIGRLKALRESQPQAFAEARAAIESNRPVYLLQDLTGTVKKLGERLAKLEGDRPTNRPGAPVRPAGQPVATSAPAAAGPDVQRLQERIKELEAAARKTSELETRLAKLEPLLSPAAEAMLRDKEDARKFRIWMGSDFTIYRTSLPPKFEERLTWTVRRDGRRVLSRVASNDTSFLYGPLLPGLYSVSLTTGAEDMPVSNTLEFAVTEEMAKGRAKKSEQEDDGSQDPDDRSPTPTPK